MNIIDYLKPSMPEYLQEQIKRIQQKIIQVRKLDSNREIFGAKLLQKSEMRKDIVIELSYKGFSCASDYS